MKGECKTDKPGRALIVGHRGSSAAAPENTLAAFEQALADGADGLEFDVRMARDRIPVVIHDRTLRRTARREGQIAAYSSAELSRLDVGSWFNLRHPDLARADFARERVPILSEVLERVANRCRVLYIELKCAGEETRRLSEAVANLVREHGQADRAIVASFTPAALKAVKQLAPEIRTAALFKRSASRPFPRRRMIIATALDAGADEIALHHSLITRRLIQAAHDVNLRILVWTVDDPVWAARAHALGLRALITNRPAQMRAALQSA